MTALSIELLLAVLLVMWALLRLVRRWSVGVRAAPAVLKGLLRLPRSYLHDVHEVVVRERGAGPMHGMVAAGFIGSALMLVAISWIAWRTYLAGVLLLLNLLVLIAGTVLVARRRYPRRPRRLSAGSFQLLPGLFSFYILSTLTLAIALTTSPQLATVGAALSGCAAILLAHQFASGPLKHVLAGLANLVVHPRFERLGARLPAAELRPLALNAPKLGIDGISDFAWNRLANFEACIECGRCEAACPANAAELPLNPKALIQQFVSAMPGSTDYQGSGHPPALAKVALEAMIHIDPSGSISIDPQTIWACTTCRACVYECPMLIEHVDAIVDLRRFQTLEKGATPGKASTILAELAATDNQHGRAPGDRMSWAVDLRLPLINQTGETDVLLWLGEGAFELRNQRSLRALVKLLRHANVDFAVLGEDEIDTGDLARRLGDEALFQSLARRNIELLSRYRFRRILTADPHVLHSLKNEYPSLGGHYEVIHHSTLLAELLEANRITLTKRLGGSVTYHDPCYLGRYNGEIAAPRAVLDRLGIERIEMARSGMRSSCCGGGGGAPQTDIAGKYRIPDQRMDHARATGAATLAVACPTCALMLDGVVGAKPVIADIAELLESAL